VQEQFAEKFPQTPVPYRSAVRRFIEKFRETVTVLKGEKSGRPSELNDKKLMEISESMLLSPLKSLRKLGQEKDIAFATAHKAVPVKLKLFPYKVTAFARIETGLYSRSWTSLPTPFISAQRLSERTVYAECS
jgi:hypothetical protein